MKNKKFLSVLYVIFIIALIAIVYFLVRRNNQEKDQLGSVFTSPDQSFQTALPNRWNATFPNKGKVMVTFVSDIGNKVVEVSPYINIAKGEEVRDLNTVFTETQSKYEAIVRNFVLQKVEDVVLEGVEGKKLYFTGTMGGRQMTYAVVITIYQGHSYTLTASSSPEVFDAVDVGLTEIIKNRKFN